ncbi:MAG: Crp/Fnr family transcriptional regulator [Rhizobiales bacterium]|nr:Crp/Fnr family transcriptional regulator [Hyphomicrobiales bacterium]MBI3672466.1 Crp/Fnr family transcriptional regulator [Hyphomicrobiales bacterium]
MALELIIAQHDESFDVWFLLKGLARVSIYSVDGQRVGFLDMGPGTIFGELSALDGQPRSASVEAVEPCAVAILPRQRFLEALASQPGFSLAVARHLTGQVRSLTTRIFEFSTMAVRQRLRAELLRMAERSAGGHDTVVLSPVPTHAELASRISTHREAVSREIAWLDDHGFTVKEGRNVRIASIARLRALLGEAWET